MTELPEPTSPLSEDQLNACPLCGKPLLYTPAWNWSEEESYEGMRCPSGCDLWEVYG